MFEQYTEKGRRAIFLARYEASQLGSPYIETEHLLLGLMQENEALTKRFLSPDSSVDSIRQQIEAHQTIRVKTSTSVDLPLSNECRRVLTYASEEAQRLSHRFIGTEHLLLGLLREHCAAASILQGIGITLEKEREVAAIEWALHPASSTELVRRPPILVLFFAEATPPEIMAALDGVAERFHEMDSSPVEWHFPGGGEHWRVLVRFDDKVFGDYTENERELVHAEVGASPSGILTLVLNQRVINEACDAAKTLVVHLLGMFYGIVDDGSGENSIWNVEQIREVKRSGFLDCYR